MLLLAGRSIAGLIIDYQWWQEMGQLKTWYSLWLYSVLPIVAATVLCFAVLWITHARALKFARTGLKEHGFYAKVSGLLLLILSVMLMLGSIDTWTVVRYFGGRSLAANPTEWHDPVFGQPLAFYLFDLPFYSLLLRVVIVTPSRPHSSIG